MIPGMNQRKMAQMMKRMGISQQEIEAEQVIIISGSKKIIIDNPSVSKVNMMGQMTYQVVGNEKIEELDSTPEITQEDIETVKDQASVSEEEAKKALEDANGDIAEAIMNLTS